MKAYLNIGLNFSVLDTRTGDAPFTLTGAWFPATATAAVRAILDNHLTVESVEVIPASNGDEACLCVTLGDSASLALQVLLERLCKVLHQDCIAVAYSNPPIDADGVLVFHPDRPHARSQWGDFNPAYWRWPAPLTTADILSKAQHAPAWQPAPSA